MSCESTITRQPSSRRSEDEWPPGESRLVELKIRQLRNLRQLDLEIDAAAPATILTGANGAGKTTVLEAIYLLARGRSFRGRKAGPLIAMGADSLTIRGWCETEAGDRRRIEFHRHGSESRHLLDGVPRETANPAAMPVAVKLVGENAQLLLEGDPALRRTFLDWNTFHVEHGFGRTRREVARILLQRNAALRAGGRGLDGWDAALAELGERLTAGRQRFFAAWRAHFLRLASRIHFLTDCDLVFGRGWSEERSLAESLLGSRDADLARGHTLFGPGRADFRLVRDVHPLALSRGQAKATVCLLQLAAELTHRDQGLAAAIWLLDDLESELDSGLFETLWALFLATGSQCLATRVSAKPDPGPFQVAGQHSMFHVEHRSTPVPG